MNVLFLNFKKFLGRLLRDLVSYKSLLVSFFSDKYYYIRYEDYYIPEELYITSTNVCNAKCIFCAYRYSVGKEKKSFMDFNIYKKAIDQYLRLGGKRLCLTPVIGDNLLDSNIFEKIEYAVNKGGFEYIYLITNGIALLNNDNYKKLIDSGIQSITISTPGFDKDVYEKIYGVNCYNLHLGGVSKLIKYNKQKQNKVNIIFGFRSPLSPTENFKTKDFVKYIKPYKNNLKFDFLVSYDNWGGMITQNDLVGIMKLKKNIKMKLLPCFRTFSAVSILPNGDVRLCGCRIKDTIYDDLVVGNLNSENLSDILKNQKTKSIRRSFVEKKYLGVCNNCSFYKPINNKMFAKFDK